MEILSRYRLLAPVFFLAQGFLWSAHSELHLHTQSPFFPHVYSPASVLPVIRSLSYLILCSQTSSQHLAFDLDSIYTVLRQQWAPYCD